MDQMVSRATVRKAAKLRKVRPVREICMVISFKDVKYSVEICLY